jgi:hypothetical protein
MAGGTKAPPQDSESGPWSMSKKQKQHQKQNLYEGKVKTLKPFARTRVS